MPMLNAAARELIESGALAHMVTIDDGVVTVFAVSTAAQMRRRGVGTALTAAALDWGRAAGADLAFLTSSDMARGMYERMGFRQVDTWHFYVRPWPAAAG